MIEYWKDLSGGQKTKLVLKIVLGIFAFIFVLRNWQSVEVIPVFFKVQMPLTLVILFSIIVGFALASIFDYKKFKVKNEEIKSLKAKLTAIEAPKAE
jgi:uncharacterized integral membrane protein